MLNKEICKKCINEHYRNNPVDQWDNCGDERRWSIGILLCLNAIRYEIKESPPNDCDYILEHMVINQNAK